jgi:hypothetical protein
LSWARTRRSRLPFEAGGLGPEQTFIRAGIFNGGLLAVSDAAGDFLDWWDERSARDCVWELDRGIHASQAWLSLVAALSTTMSCGIAA